MLAFENILQSCPLSINENSMIYREIKKTFIFNFAKIRLNFFNYLQTPSKAYTITDRFMLRYSPEDFLLNIFNVHIIIPFIKIEIASFPFNFSSLKIVWLTSQVFFFRMKWSIHSIINNESV